MTWKNFDGKPYDRAALAAHINAQDFSRWRNKHGDLDRPKFITLHNTSEPSIKTWLGWSFEKAKGYINNIDDWYASKGWKAGPHFFVPPTANPVAWGFSDLGTCGTHCSCFNDDSVGVEMVGQFDTEAFDSGPGAIVRDNSVYLLALLHRKLRLDPHNMRFHIECKADNHDCPGKNVRVRRDDLVARIAAEMARLGDALPQAPPPEPPVVLRRVVATAGDGLNLRAGPGASSVALQVIAKGTELAVVGEATNGETAWLRVQDPAGWVAERFTTPVTVAPTPAPAPGAARQELFRVEGKMSTFGGPKDTGMSAIEGLGLFASEEAMRQHGLADWLLSPTQANAVGLGRRLMTSRFYVACRWNTAHYPLLRDAVAHVSAKGKTVLARPMDWGPNANTGRVADLSPGLAAALGLETDDECTVVVYEDGK